MFRPPRTMSVDCVSPTARLLRGARFIFFIGAAALLSAAYGRAQQKAGTSAPQAPDQKPAEYVGSDTCQGCHEDIFNGFQKNPHHAVETDKKRGYETKACESCHGPGSKHAESMSAADIRNPAKLKPAEADKICLTCHLNQPTHVGRISSSHARNQVACISCHAIHKNGPDGLVARKTPDMNKLCAGCHNDVWASFQRPFGHKVTQGAMSCVDCHNPHGTVRPYSIQTVSANEPGCLRCHGDKAGPFVFQHAPVRTEGCGACHVPHGSENPRLLTRAEVRFVCLECHSNVTAPAVSTGNLGLVPPAIHDLRSPRFQNCTNCHQKVHGSYVNRDLLK